MQDDDRQELGQDLLPGWSALVVMLMIFGALSLITLMTLLHGEDDDIDPEAGGRVAYGPADFPEIDFDMELLPAVAQASSGGKPVEFTVPPPPFSDESLFPCSFCHEDLEVNTERRELVGFHDEIALDHGSEDRWCLDCHGIEDRDSLRLVNGTMVGFDESYKLCGQCHGTIYRDWRAGIHGRRRGFWNGAKEYLLCAHCHNPHSPAYEPIKPMPPPVRPQYLATAAEPESDEPEPGGTQE